MRRVTILGLMFMTGLTACDRRDSAPQAPSAIEVNVPSTAPTTVPVAAAPTSSFITIGDRMIQFPPAHIRIREDDEGRIALLCSAKPANFDESKTGNSYYFQMVLDMPEGGTVADASWRYKAATSEAVDSPNGIFLDGTTTHLQPFDVAVQFEDQAPYLAVYITGQFLSVVDTSDAPADFVPVSARLIAKIDGAGK